MQTVSNRPFCLVVVRPASAQGFHFNDNETKGLISFSEAHG